MSKYRSQKITINGETFDSKKEYRRWQELKLLERAGEISGLDRQVKFELLPVQKNKRTGKVIERACSYFADFTYWEKGRFVVEDAKGFRTPEYKLKKKMMLYFHGIRIKEV